MDGLARPLLVSLVTILVFGVGSARALEAQSRGNRGGAVAQQAVTLSAQVKAQIGDFYFSRRAANAQALPPGIRRRLERGKPLPPGIAKKSAPLELSSRLTLPEGSEIVEVGLDVFLVEVATDIIHDVLMDVIR
ncbi:MAG: anti-virulence regulator CigR family protein [Longimicrobiales bacterium]|nr:anti-virulence regulator CigR family protein [Longimicrobiales bacterium]